MSAKLLREMFGLVEMPAINGSAAPKAEAGAGAAQGLRVTGDKATLGALQEALQEAGAALNDNPDLAEWCEKAWKAVAQGARDGGSVTLPAFTETPDIDSFNDDEGPGPEEEY